MKSSIIISTIWLCCLSGAFAQISLKTPSFLLEINSKGEITRLENPVTQINYLPANEKGYLIRLKKGAQIWTPESCSFKNNILHFKFPGKTEVRVKATEKDTYIKFELMAAQPMPDVLLWGPFPTSIRETIGEFVGVVRDSKYAIGLITLNAKTSGGVLSNDEGVVYERGSTAIGQPYGCSLQAFCIDRNKDRKITIINDFPGAFVPANPEGALPGSAIALFGQAPETALATIGKIELAEGLPHPMLNGKWIKDPESGAGNPYLITTFTEENIDELLGHAQRIGFYSIYHSHPFKNWGHFDLLDDQFPNGRAGMKTCVEKAAKAGIRTGVHTLTNFITTNDLFVQPVPHQGLAFFAETSLTQSLSETDTEIFIKDTLYYQHQSTVQALRIGNEIIRFSGVSAGAPFKLLECQRGAFGTTAARHTAGSHVRRLVDHGYQTFYPNWEMQKELIQNIVGFFNETGVSHLDFDGHEGTFGSGNGDFAMGYFPEKFLSGVRHQVVNGSSRSNHFYWHMNTYLNWGEPWYAGFKESQGDYRFQNQVLLERNYMPNMLGWFLFTNKTTLEEMEWMLARSAGYNAGYALVAELSSFRENPQTDTVIQQITLWEEARKRKIFNAKQLEALKNPNIDFSITKDPQQYFRLQYYTKTFVEHQKTPLQPGQPTFTEWRFENSAETQPLSIKLGADGKQGTISEIKMEIDGARQFSFPVVLGPSESFIYDGQSELLLYDNKGRLKERITLNTPPMLLEKGPHIIRFNGSFSASSDLTVKGYIKLKEKVEIIQP
jgi:hypothetical protein